MPREDRPSGSLRPPINPAELRVYVFNLPLTWSTLAVYEVFSKLGNVARIKLDAPRRMSKNATVTFRPAPLDVTWVGLPLRIDAHGVQQVYNTRDNSVPERRMRSKSDQAALLPTEVAVPLASVGLGVLEDNDSMRNLISFGSLNSIPAAFAWDGRLESIVVTFGIQWSEGNKTPRRSFKIVIPVAQATEILEYKAESKSTLLILSIKNPPLIYEKTANVASTHRKDDPFWDESRTWYRQTGIMLHSDKDNQAAVTLLDDTCLVEFGRWLTYRLELGETARGSQEFQDLRRILIDNNISVRETPSGFRDRNGRRSDLYDWLGRSQNRTQNLNRGNSSILDMEQMANGSIYLDWRVRYQLDVCLSHSILQECAITRDFLTQLSRIDVNRAVKMLERAANSTERLARLEDILRLQDQVSVVEKKRPSYCAKVPTAAITPTTMYLATPTLETSNRIIRQYAELEDRFLRVRFTDERFKGKIMPPNLDDQSMEEIFGRIRRTLTHGIEIGDRHFEFLAFGNSQFRENGAYFFSSTSSLTADMIRASMGNFDKVKTIPKYIARMGQCFSTTRNVGFTSKVSEIPDIERNGYCFTDGVGRISPMLARLIADVFKIPHSDRDHPSVFQFRLGGCKGILTVDPALKGMEIQVRPSQQKFQGKFLGLEICRISQFSTAYLNAQLILVLSTLGVPDRVFLYKLRQMIADLKDAITNSQKASQLLLKTIDFNQTTVTLAGMILDGFMETKEPYFISCLRLWRSWSLKYLKEKARLFIDQGAFVLGTVDETSTLRGHFERQTFDGKLVEGPLQLPQIFLQVPDHGGKYCIREGICIVARNPSLHAGDVRVVQAVDVPSLHHLRDCVVFPQTGDRDLANMCSGGDLDGDDYLVIWDKDFLPVNEWNHPPMDYTAPTPKQHDGKPTTAEMVEFFINYIKNDCLGQIACNHRYWADCQPDGVRDAKCVTLAHLHSKAVDYNKTGVPAQMPDALRLAARPHWAEPKGKFYRSNKILGRIYDEVEREAFHPALDQPFDDRILNACSPTNEMLEGARQLKVMYDEDLRRIMVQYGVRTEFEVCTTFALEHQERNDYKFAEKLGEVVATLKQRHQDSCYEKAGTNATERDWGKMEPFIVAMYKVTADEVYAASTESKQASPARRSPTPVTATSFMSFPWIFTRELGIIARKDSRGASLTAFSRPTFRSKAASSYPPHSNMLGSRVTLSELPEIQTATGPVQQGEELELFDDKGA